MKKITSKDNPEYKKALKLTRKKYRDREGLYLIEGIKPLEDALQTGCSIEKIFVTEGEENHGFPESITDIISPALFAELSDTETSQGVIAVVRQQDPSGAEKMLSGGGRLLVLDRIQDPGNLGTMIRTAEAAGMAGVVLLKGCADVYSPKVVRAAAGSLFRMDIFTGAEEELLIDKLKNFDRKIVVTALEGASEYTDVTYDNNCAIVIGNEGQGVSRGFLEHADLKIKIPMAGAIESLNAAVAAGIIMYESQKTNVR